MVSVEHSLASETTQDIGRGKNGHISKSPSAGNAYKRTPVELATIHFFASSTTSKILWKHIPTSDEQFID